MLVALRASRYSDHTMNISSLRPTVPVALVALVALWLLVVEPTFLVEGIGGVAFGITAVFLVAAAVVASLLRIFPRAVAYPAPDPVATGGLAVASAVVFACVLYAEPSPVVRWTMGIVGPGLGLLMFALGAALRGRPSS